MPFVGKILVPQVRETVLRRRRLLDLVHRSLARRVTCVSSPPGYGKTTLAASFLVDSELPGCWYALDEADEEPRVFLEYLLAAIQLRFPGFGRRTRAALDGAGTDVQTVMGTLTTEMHLEIPEGFLLVFDDVHVLGPGSPALAALDSLVQHAPEQCRILLLSRSSVELPCLPRLAAAREVRRITPRDLAFTDEEAEELLSTLGVSASPEIRDRLIQRCEGWVAGLVLSTLDDGAELSAPGMSSDEELFRYLTNEVYGRQTREARDLLRRSSVLYEVTPEACAGALGVRSPGSLLRQVAESVQFVTCLEGGEIYRYHSLLRSFLVDLLRQDEAEFLAVHRRAGRYFASRQHWEASLYHFHQAGYAEEAARVIELAAPDVYSSGQWGRLAGWIDDLPAVTLRDHPALLIQRARCAVQIGHADIAMRYCAEAEDAINSGAGWLRPHLHVARAAAYRLQGLLDLCIEEADAALECLAEPQTNSDRFIQGQAFHFKGMALLLAGRYQDAVAVLQAALERHRELGELFWMSLAHHHLGFASRKLGARGDAMGHYDQALAGWRKLRNGVQQASTLNNLGFVHAERDPVLAEETLREAVKQATECGAVRVLAHAQDSLGLVLSIQGKHQEALGLYEQARESAREASEHQTYIMATEGLGLVRLAAGDVERASILVDEAAGLAGEQTGAELASHVLVSQGAVAAVQNRRTRARRLFEQALALLETSGSRENLARAHLHAGALYWNEGDPRADAAVQALGSFLREPGSELMLIPDARLHVPFVRHAASLPGLGDGFRRLFAGIERFRPKMSPVPDTAPGDRGASGFRAYALGRAHVEMMGTGHEVRWPTEKAKEMLFFLLARAPWVRKEEIIAALWPDSSSPKADTQFWSTAYRLRRGLSQECLVRRDSLYGINPDLDVWFDAREFQTLVRDALRVGGEREPGKEDVVLLERALELYNGPFLPMLYSDWVEELRGRLLDQFLSGLLVLARVYVERGAIDRAVELCDRALEADPLLEEAYVVKIKALAGAGRDPEADQAIRRYVQVVHDELGEEPDGKIVGLRERMQMGRYA